MGVNKIVTQGLVFDDGDKDNLISGSCFIGNSLPGDELSIDTLTAVVDCAEEMPTLFQPADADGMLTKEDELFGVRPIVRLLVNDLSVYSYGEPVSYYHGETLIGKFYMASVKRVGKFNYEISCISAVGLLDNDTHYGGMYNGTPMEEVLSDIVGGMVGYTLAPAFMGLPVYGWLPVATRRENLHQLLFAMGASLQKNTAGEIQIVALTSENPAELLDDRIFLGGSVAYGAPATSASVSEHAYMAYDSDDTATLYEAEVPAEPMTTPRGASVNGALVLFEGPMHGLVVENGEILESGVNYAVLGPSSQCTLTGKKYTHTVRVITMQAPATRALGEEKDNVITVKDATLVSLANAENVASRVFSYFSSAKTVETDLVMGTERPGDPVTFSDPFGEQTEGFIRSMDVKMGRTLRASATLVSGYVPTGIGNYYEHSVLLTEDQTWTVPESCKGKIRVVLIGGGQGGHGGCKGANGKGESSSSSTGVGGQGGQGGEGGRIYVTTLYATVGRTFSATMGTGGSGGISDTAGMEGTATVFDSYSSADGRPSTSGYAELFGGGVYGLPGEMGVAGANGGESLTYGGVTYPAGELGKADSSGGITAYGGQGGGAAVGNAGKPGNDGEVYKNPDGTYSTTPGSGGQGGQGGPGSAATVYGCGGQGGHGGGGGGAEGSMTGTSSSVWHNGGGTGGLGGQGGKGAAGCVVIYY